MEETVTYNDVVDTSATTTTPNDTVYPTLSSEFETLFKLIGIDSNRSLKPVKITWFSILIPIICILGIIGNITNLVVLTNHRLTSRSDRAGRSIYKGFVALAISDMCFCAFVLPRSFIPLGPIELMDFRQTGMLLYRHYGVFAINYFLTVSTWLVVLIAFGRLKATTDPMRVNFNVLTNYMGSLLLATFLLAFVVNLPNLLYLSPRRCYDFMTDSVHLSIYPTFDATTTYRLRLYITWVWPIVVDFIPTVILLSANIKLICELRRTQRLRNTLGVRGNIVTGCSNPNTAGPNETVLLTLVCIVALSIVLVSPAQIIGFFARVFHFHSKTWINTMTIANTCQTFKFAANFLLYCSVNKHYRNIVGTCVSRLCCKRKVITGDHGSRGSSQPAVKGKKSSTSTGATHDTHYHSHPPNNSPVAEQTHATLGHVDAVDV